MSQSDTIRRSVTEDVKPDNSLGELLDRVLDGETGIVRFVSLTDLQADEPPLFVGMAEMVDTRKLSPRRLSSGSWQTKAREAKHETGLEGASGTIHSSGAGLTREVALWATVGEACERYALNYHLPEDDVFARFTDLPGDVVDPSSLILFSDEQYATPSFPFHRHDPTVPRYWGVGVSLVTGRGVHFPAELYTGAYSAPHFQPLDGTYSTGCAAGPTYKHALFSGLCEVIERDAFMFYWLTGIKPPSLSVEGLREFLSPELLQLLDFPHIKVSLRWLKTDLGLPSVGCFITSTSARGFACGASCHPDWRKAVEKAVIEAFHTLNWTVDLDRWMKTPREAKDIRDFPHHVQHYLDPANHKNVAFLAADDAVDQTRAFLKEYSGRQKTYQEAIAHVHAKGYEALAIDRTYEDMESVSLFVVHVVVPGLQPLHVGLGLEHRDTRRLKTIAARLELPMPEQLNLAPHPFP